MSRTRKQQFSNNRRKASGRASATKYPGIDAVRRATRGTVARGYKQGDVNYRRDGRHGTRYAGTVETVQAYDTAGNALREPSKRGVQGRLIRHVLHNRVPAFAIKSMTGQVTPAFGSLGDLERHCRKRGFKYGVK